GPGLVGAPTPFECAGPESRARRLVLGRETGLLVAAGLGSLPVRSPLGPHPAAQASIRAMNPACLGAAIPYFIGQWSHSVNREGKCLLDLTGFRKEYGISIITGREVQNDFSGGTQTHNQIFGGLYDAQTLPAFRFVSLQPGFAARRLASAHPRCLPPGLARRLPRLSRFPRAAGPGRNRGRRSPRRRATGGRAGRRCEKAWWQVDQSAAARARRRFVTKAGRLDARRGWYGRGRAFAAQQVAERSDPVGGRFAHTGHCRLAERRVDPP